VSRSLLLRSAHVSIGTTRCRSETAPQDKSRAENRWLSGHSSILRVLIRFKMIGRTTIETCWITGLPYGSGVYFYPAWRRVWYSNGTPLPYQSDGPIGLARNHRARCKRRQFIVRSMDSKYMYTPQATNDHPKLSFRCRWRHSITRSAYTTHRNLSASLGLKLAKVNQHDRQ